MKKFPLFHFTGNETEDARGRKAEPTPFQAATIFPPLS